MALHMQTLRFNGIVEDENGSWLDVTPLTGWQPVQAAVAVETTSTVPAKDSRERAREDKVAHREAMRNHAKAAKAADGK